MTFQCPSCGKSFRVPEAMAGRSAKCKKCGERMRVPVLEQEPAQDDDFIPLKPDEDEAPPTTKPAATPAGGKRAAAAVGDLELPGPDRSGQDLSDSDEFDAWADPIDEGPDEAPDDPIEPALMGGLETLAAPGNASEPEPEPVLFSPPTGFARTSKPSRRSGSIGGGLVNNVVAMWDALVNPSGAGAGGVALKHKVSMGGSFLLISGALLLFFGAVQATPEQVRRVQSVLGTVSTARWANTAGSLAPMMLVAVAGCIAGLVVSGWRYWSPRQEEEAGLVTVVFWGTLGLVIGSSLIALLGGGGVTLLMSQIGAIGILVAAAAFGVWVYLRLTSDGDGSMALLLIAPAVIMPATFLILILSNLPEGVEFGDLPWDKLFLIAFCMFLFLILMGGAIGFMILIGLPLQLLGIVERPPMPVDVPGGAGGTGMMAIGGFCGLCYLLLVISRWKLMLKPVAWQVIILFFGVFLMVSLQNFAYRAQVAKVERQIAEEDERLTALLQAEGTIPPLVTASHERFPGNQDVFVGFEREEVVFLSNGDSMSRKGGFHEGWVDPDAPSTPRYGPGPSGGFSQPDLAQFDPTLGSTDPGPIRFIDPSTDPRPDLGPIGGHREDDGPELQIRARNVYIVFDTQDLQPGEENPQGRAQPDVLASWTPFPFSSKVVQSIGVRPLYTAKGQIIANPTREDLMAYGMLPDERPKSMLWMVPQFDPRYLPRGVVATPRSQRSSGDYDGEPGSSERWPTFLKPPTVDTNGSLPFDFYGYTIDILPGYEVKAMTRDRETGIRTLTIAPAVQAELDHPPLEIHLVPQDIGSRGDIRPEQWGSLVRELDPVALDPYYEYGLIDGQRFARISPDAWRYQSRDMRYYYASQMLDTPYWVGMSISSAMQSPAGILECEAMARSLRRVPVSEPVAVPYPDEIEPGTAARTDAGTIRAKAWHVNGIFAYPKGMSDKLRPAVETEHKEALAFDWSYEGVGIFIELRAIDWEQYTETRVQKHGPELLGNRDTFNDLDYAGRIVPAYGREVSYVKLWEDAVFVRVDHGPMLMVDGVLYSEVGYYGWLGEYWVEARLRGREDIEITLGELERHLRSMRLAYPIELSKGKDFEEWAVRYIRSSTRRQKMPLAGGTSLGEAFDLHKENRDDDPEVVFAEGVDPYGGLDPEVFATTTTPSVEPKTPVVTNPDDPADPEPEAPAGLPPVPGFKQWTTDEGVRKYLGATQAFGRFEFRPLQDLRQSARSTETSAEWSAKTGAGKVGLSLRFEKLRPGEQPIDVPITTDEATGKVTLRLGRRTLKPGEPPKVTYRDVDGLRIWRLLMPQVGGAGTRRCYYLVSIPEGNLVIAADFERDKAVQLQAMDASVATLVLNAE